MFVRVKTKGPYRYLQIVENHREGKCTAQRVLATLGRADGLAESGVVDALLKSLGRFATQVRVIEGCEQGRLEAGALRHIGPDLVLGRLWKELGLDTALNRLLKDRGFKFPVERAVYLTVLHRLVFAPPFCHLPVLLDHVLSPNPVSKKNRIHLKINLVALLRRGAPHVG